MLFYADMLDRQKADRQREGLTNAAFVAYLQGAGKDKTWNAYLQALGLVEKTAPITKEAKKKIVKKSQQIAERIMRMDRTRPKKAKRKKINGLTNI